MFLERKPNVDSSLEGHHLFVHREMWLELHELREVGRDEVHDSPDFVEAIVARAAGDRLQLIVAEMQQAEDFHEPAATLYILHNTEKGKKKFSWVGWKR
jgi:hypothetical protein